jgi:DNA-binding FadR family transcriptional regulator
MPFRPVEPEKLSTAVIRQIEDLILRGILRPGERLPSERELSERLSVSRPSLRDAIASLQDDGLLTSKAMTMRFSITYRFGVTWRGSRQSAPQNLAHRLILT